MPNWCENDLTLRGPGLKEAIEQLGGNGEPLDFNTLIPYPEEFDQKDKEAAMREAWWAKADPETRDKYPLIKDGFNSGGYEWCVQHWGTKWNANCDKGGWNFSPTAATALLSFSTAWSPPMPVIAALAARFPQLTVQLRYYEAGVGFSGRLTYRKGKLVIDTHNNNYRGRRGG